MKFVAVDRKVVLVEDKEDILQKDDLLLVKDGTMTEISSNLMAVAQKIEAYCGRKVKTNIHIQGRELNVRFTLSYGRYIEFETPDNCFSLSVNDENYYVLQLKYLSHYSRMCLVMQIMRDVFDLDLEMVHEPEQKIFCIETKIF